VAPLKQIKFSNDCGSAQVVEGRVNRDKCVLKVAPGSHVGMGSTDSRIITRNILLVPANRCQPGFSQRNLWCHQVRAVPGGLRR